MKTLGDVIEEGRKAKGLNLYEAAARLKMSRMTLRRLEENHTKLVSIDGLVDIANSLEIDFHKMLIAYGVRFINIQLLSVFRVGKRLFYGDVLLDTNKLEELIKKNINSLKSGS